MHFFTDPSLLVIPQPAADAFGPVNDNKYNISSKHKVSTDAKIFACQNAMMLVLPHVESGGTTVSTSLVNVVLQPIEGLGINHSPVKYYIYRGLEKVNFFTTGDAITPLATSTSPNPNETEFTKKFWDNWNAYKTDTNQTSLSDPSSESFGFKATHHSVPANRTIQLIELFNSEASTNLYINDFQAIKVSEGEWIGMLKAGVNFEFEIIVDTDHLKMDLEYAMQHKQIVDATGLTGFAGKMKREAILNYLDPAAFFGMHFEVGVDLAKYVSGVKEKPVPRLKKDLVDDIVNKFLNNTNVYLDVRSEKGYSYFLYENYKNDTPPTTPTTSPTMNIKSASATAFNFLDNLLVKWPLINLTAPLAPLVPLVDGDQIDLQLRLNDNTRPLLFAENPKLFGASSVDNFKKETDLLPPPPAPPTPPPTTLTWSETVSLEIPHVVDTGVKSNVAHHIKLQYFRQEDTASSPNTVFKAPGFLDAAFGTINIVSDLDVKTPFNHFQNSKRTFIGDSTFSYVARSGVFQKGTQVLYYTQNDFSLVASSDVYPKFDASAVPENSIDDVFRFKSVVMNKWKINDGSNDIYILGITAYNRLSLAVTPKEDLLLLGLSKQELTDLNSITGVAALSDLHHKYFYLTELFDGTNPFVDTISGTPYKKYRVDVQGIDPATKEVKVVDTSGAANKVIVYGMSSYILCTEDFGAASLVPEQLPDPGVYDEKYVDFQKLNYGPTTTFVDDLFPGGMISVKDNKMTFDGGQVLDSQNVNFDLWGQMYYPIDQKSNSTSVYRLSNVQDDYPMVVICHANGGLYTEYEKLAVFLAKNGFIVCTVSALAILRQKYNVFKVSDLPSAVPPASTANYEEFQYYFDLANFPYANPSKYYIFMDNRHNDLMFFYGNDSANTSTYEKVISVKYNVTALKHPYVSTFGTDPSELAVKPNPPDEPTIWSKTKGTDFEIFIDPTPVAWEKEGTTPGIKLGKFGLAWLKNVGSGSSTAAQISKVGTRFVELTATDWASDLQSDIKAAIDGATDLPTVDIPYPATGIGKYYGTILDDIYYMIKVDNTTTGPCSSGTGTCVIINVEVKNRQMNFLTKDNIHGAKILSRANLVFPHLQIVKRFIEQNCPKSGVVNRIQNNIGLIGHSRGAEAVVRCVAEVAGGIPSFDTNAFITAGTDDRTGPEKWRHLPNNLDNINAVISLAPTDDSNDQEESISEDIPYFVLYGSLEGDVTGTPKGVSPNRTSGFSIYDRSNNNTEKAMAFVYGATHNGFITNNRDFSGKVKKFGSSAPNGYTGTPIVPGIQNRITLAYMNGFLRIHLKGENIWRPYFYGEQIPASIAYNKIYLQYKNMASSTGKWINDFQGSAGTTTLDGNPPSGSGKLKYGELISLDDRTPHDTKGISVRWKKKKGGVLLIEVPAANKDASGFEFLSFRIGMVYSSSGSYADLSTIEVELHYTGMPSTVYKKVVNRSIPEPDLRKSPSASIGGTIVSAALTKTAMMTIRVPLSEFQTNGVDLTKITKVQLTFPKALAKNGRVLIDDFEFTD